MPANDLKHATDPDLKHCYLVVKVTLDQIRPPIWRRVVMPASITLDMLHDVLQVVMGWEDYHLHQFTIAGRRFTEFVADDDPNATDIGENENGIVLAALLTQGMGGVKQKFTYAYDFGDGWQHTLTVEKIDPIPEGHEVRISCLAGRRRCPPEDVGGIFGYEQYLQALADPKHPQHKELLRWRGPFDSEALDLDEINRDLAWLKRWSRPRKR